MHVSSDVARGSQGRSRIALGTALAVSLIAAFTGMTPTSPTSASASTAHKAVPGACAQKQVGALFRAEAASLGLAHACEHRRARLQQPVLTGARDGDEAAPRGVAAAALDPAVAGSWSAAVNPGTATIGISAVVLHTGKVLLLGGKYEGGDISTAGYLYDPLTRTGHEVRPPAAVFCGSVVQLSDGRVLSVGGSNPNPHGIVDVWLFDPITEEWIRQPNTPLGRYYPTSTRMADGRVVITTGLQTDGSTRNPKVELYTPPPDGGSLGTLRVVGPNHSTSTYPHQWLMPDGNMLQFAQPNSAFRFTTGTWSWTSLPRPGVATGGGTAKLLLPSRPSGSSEVMIVGGLHRGTGLRTTQLFDYRNPAAGWSLREPMPTGRGHMNLVQVPDGSAFGIGGNGSALFNVPQRQTLHYNPRTDTWRNMAVQSPRRAYHSTAVLLPDGRILSAGDNGPGGGLQAIDFYSPPYLFKGPRPVITTVPRQVAHGSTFDIATSGPAVTRAVLMAPGATTHANDMNARHVELAVTATADGLSATVGNPRITPPGYYMLFVLTRGGVPSVARWVHVGP